MHAYKSCQWPEEVYLGLWFECALLLSRRESASIVSMFPPVTAPPTLSDLLFILDKVRALSCEGHTCDWFHGNKVPHPLSFCVSDVVARGQDLTAEPLNKAEWPVSVAMA